MKFYRFMNCKACLDALTYFLYDARGAMGFSLAQAMLTSPKAGAIGEWIEARGKVELAIRLAQQLAVGWLMIMH